MLAEKFGMEYVDADGKKKNPYIIHRTSIGCYERTLALLIEKYAGALPLWLAPEQVRVLPISEKQNDAVAEAVRRLKEAGFRAEADWRNEKIGYKIREAQMDKIPYMLVIGDREAQSGAVSVRSRSGGDLGVMPLDEFVARRKKRWRPRPSTDPCRLWAKAAGCHRQNLLLLHREWMKQTSLWRRRNQGGLGG